MRNRMERLVVLPFSFGCVSQASVAVSENNSKKTRLESNPCATSIRGQEGDSLSGAKMKNSYGFLALTKSNISFRFQKLMKSFTQLFLYKEEVEEMEIGFPTDVKHVTHIGLDGSATTNPIKAWDDHLRAPDFSLPALSLKQFELAMAAQADVPLVNISL